MLPSCIELLAQLSACLFGTIHRTLIFNEGHLLKRSSLDILYSLYVQNR